MGRSVALFIPFRYEIFSDSIADFVFPEHVDLVFMPGATLTVPSGVTVHIHGRVEAADIPVFCTPGKMATGGIVLASALGGTVRLLSPRQRFVNLRWFGAMATAEGNEQHARYYNSDFALQAALDCASVNRVNTRDESNNPLSAADRVLLPPLEVLASGGNYRLHNQVTVQRGAMSDAWGGRNPKVVVRGTAFQGGGSPSTFTFDRALPSPPDMPAGVAPPEPVDLLRIEGGVDLDLRNIEFKSTQRPNACVTSPP